MKVKEMIKYLKTQDPEREMVIFEYDTSGEYDVSRFYSIVQSGTPKANSKNLLVFLAKGVIKRVGDDAQ